MSDEKMFDPSMKKKKKKKPVEEEAEAEAPPEEPSVEDIDVVLGKKKKKKKKPLDMTEMSENLPEETEDANASVTLEFGDKKKKKKKKDLDLEPSGEAEADVEVDSTNDECDHKYEDLLHKAFSLMRERNPEMISGERKRMMMIPPSVARVGTKKTMFANFNEVTKQLRRPPRHLLQFLLAELGTSGSIDGNNQLLLKGRYQIKHIEHVLRNYIREYVMCHTCKRTETELNKDTRLYFLECRSCGSRCSVQSIKSGFQAVTGKRAALRAKTA